MKTEDLVSLLAADVAPVDRHAPGKRFAWALLFGIVGAVVLMAVLFGVRRDIGEAILMPMFWVRLGFAIAMAAASLVVTARLSRPGMRPGKAWLGVAAPVLAAWIAAAVMLALAAPDARLGLILGHTWRVCPLCIAILSTPAFVTIFWAIKGLAPTLLRLAGAAGGLLAGATGTMAYCLHCPELAAPFWSLWYLLGMAVPTVVGALLGPRLLRW
jgi:hypothetical protein